MGEQIDMDAVINEVRKGWQKHELGPTRGEGPVCLMGAYQRVCLRATGRHGRPTAFNRAVLAVADEYFPGRSQDPESDDEFRCVPAFNDHPDTTLDDVLLVLEKARAEQ